MLTTKSLSWWQRLRLVFKRPSVGDSLWFRAMELPITKVDRTHMRVTAENVRFRVTVSLREIEWENSYWMWHVPGRDGNARPKRVRGAVVVPHDPNVRTKRPRRGRRSQT